jgi:hypothetical protein
MCVPLRLASMRATLAAAPVRFAPAFGPYHMQKHIEAACNLNLLMLSVYALPQPCRGVILIKVVHPDIDVMKLAEYLFDDIAKTQAARTRYHHIVCL